MSTALRVLLIEDSEDDAQLLLRELRRGGYEPTYERIETPEAMKAALDDRTWDIIISDYVMPHFSGPAALGLLKESGLDLPIIIVSGKIGEEAAVAMMKAGAHDYIMKDNPARLVPAIERELKEAEMRRERMEAEKIQKALARYQSPDIVDAIMEMGVTKFDAVERYVTVLFIDMLGSTKRAEEEGPKKMSQILNTFLELATEEVLACKGHVNKFIGDEVMAVFNAPLELENHEEMAVNAAIRMLERIDKHDHEHPDLAFSVRIGINSGLTMAGDVGPKNRYEYTVIGETVNVAARMTKLPWVNKIIIGRNTYDKIKNVFTAKEIGPVMLQGVSDMLEIYEVVISPSVFVDGTSQSTDGAGS
ncbi:MAG: adenylate/guanylate cyclase domain-containing protein [Candidatus Neomarinimicrobiota bacterium]